MNDFKLILLTRRFPYFTTESFLESEIPLLAKAFSRIVIYPTETSDYIRNVPNNVRVVGDFSSMFKNKRKRALRTIFSLTFYKTVYFHLRQVKSLSDIKFVFKYVASYLAYLDFFLNLDELEDTDIVYTYWFNEAPLAFSDIKIAKKLRFKIVSRVHRYDLYEGMKSTPSFWVNRQQTLNQTDCIFSISSDGKNYIESKYPFSKCKITVSKLGVYDRGKIAECSKGDNFAIVSVSRVHIMKRVGFILDSIIAFASSIPDTNITWTHFGDGDEIADLKAKARNISPKNLLVDFRGNVPNKIIYDHYTNEPTDLFINLSSSEGIPVSIMEAQSFGIPTIATNVGGSCEIVVPQTGVLLSENPDIGQVVEALNNVLLRKSVNSTQVKEYWKNNFDAGKNYLAFSNAILALVQK